MTSRFFLTAICAAAATIASAPADGPPAALPAGDAPLAIIYETGVVLSAAELLPGIPLRGASYRVRDRVETDGYMAHFVIDSDFGTFAAVGVPQAKLRIIETEAIRKLVETSKSDLFAEGIRRSIEQPIDAVKNIVKDPVKSVKQVPKTVGHFFGRVGASLERGVQRVGNSLNESDTSIAEVGHGVGNAAKSAAGFDEARLQTAKQLGVDPYSDNQRLQEEINKVTWAFFAGGLPLRIGAAAASAGIALTATNTLGLPDEIYALTPAELALRDRDALTAIGVRDNDIRDFQLHKLLSVSRQHRIVTLLVALPKASGRADVVQLATACITTDQADFLIAGLAILAERQGSGAADYVALKVLGRLPGATTTGGALEVPAPVDYVTWTEAVADFAARDDLGAAPKTLVHTGTLAPAAAVGFAAVGWTLQTVPYPAK